MRSRRKKIMIKTELKQVWEYSFHALIQKQHGISHSVWRNKRLSDHMILFCEFFVTFLIRSIGFLLAHHLLISLRKSLFFSFETSIVMFSNLWHGQSISCFFFMVSISYNICQSLENSKDKEKNGQWEENILNKQI